MLGRRGCEGEEGGGRGRKREEGGGPHRGKLGERRVGKVREEIRVRGKTEEGKWVNHINTRQNLSIFHGSREQPLSTYPLLSPPRSCRYPHNGAPAGTPGVNSH